MRIKVYRTECTDPYRNLAMEEQLTYSASDGEIVLYLWQNAKTVVIGKNQNPWRECNVERIKEDGVKLARRLSGGGAVYHDLGNLNFTFIARDGVFDVGKQTETILLACRLLGINAKLTGRNDLVVDGRKFSGHAYFSSKGYNYHHGTIMLDVVAEDMPRYLQVSEAKLKSKGVASVRSRVVNLKEFLPWKSRKKLVAEMEKAMIKALCRTYGEGLQPEELELSELPELDQELYKKYESEEWRLGSRLAFEKSIEHRFDWGEVEVQLAMRGEFIEKCRIYSDALDTEMFGPLEELLAGCKYDKASILNLKRPAGSTAEADEIIKLVALAVE